MWNIGGAAGLIGRFEPEMESVLDEQLAIDKANAALNESSESNLFSGLLDAGVAYRDAYVVRDAAHPDVLQIALGAVEDAVAAANEPTFEQDPAGSTHYQQTLDDTRDAIFTALENNGYDTRYADDAAAGEVRSPPSNDEPLRRLPYPPDSPIPDRNGTSTLLPRSRGGRRRRRTARLPFTH